MNLNLTIQLPIFKVVKIVSTLSQSMGWGIKQLNVPSTWSITEGEGITIMVIDTGYSNHKDLEGCILKDKCKSFVITEQEIDDKNGHSTHIQGIIGARNNEMGVVGVAPKCNIITCKVLNENGGGLLPDIKKALDYAIEIKPDIVSMSLGAPFGSSDMYDGIKKLYDLNIPVVCAAGNDGRENSVNYPAKYEETIAVTAFDKEGQPAYFNSTGSEVDFAAPGVEIYSTWLNNEYAMLQGSSMACPFISGLIALLIAKHHKQEKETGQNDCKTVEQIREHLKKYADDKGIVGKDNIWGYGVIDPLKLINENGFISSPTQPQPEKLSWWQKILKWFRR